MGKVLIIARGGYGDIFPLLAIGAVLQRRGHQVAVAAEAHHAAACADLGLPLHAIPPHAIPPHAIPPHAIPLHAGNDAGARTDRAPAHWAADYGGDCAANGLAGDSAPHGGNGVAAANWRARLDATLAPDGLRAEVERLRPLAAAADLLLGNQLAYAGAIVRRLLHKPWVFCAASPLAIPSYRDPPLWPLIDGLQRRTAALGLPETPYLSLARVATRVLMRSQLRLQERLGLPTQAHPRFEGMYSERLNLLATSPVLIDPQPDWPPHTRLTGFCWYEPGFLGDETQAESLRAFAAAGSPPLVFTAGGGRRTSPGRFYEESIAAARRLGRRAILVASPRIRDHLAIANSAAAEDVRLTGYLPYSRLFGLAAVVVHSGGIGTIGWTLRCAVPSLLVPSDWDQHDNARRAARRGFARVLPMARYTARAAAEEIAALLDDQTMRQRLMATAPEVIAEDGAQVAADRIESLLHNGSQTTTPRA